MRKGKVQAGVASGLNKRFDLSKDKALREIEAVNRKIREGFPAHQPPGSNKIKSALAAAAEELGENRRSMFGRVGSPNHRGTWKLLFGLEPDWNWVSEETKKEQKRKEKLAPFATSDKDLPYGNNRGHTWELVSGKDNKFRFACFGDFHAASKYCRPDVREDLTRRAEDFGAQVIFDTGNWIDGEASFNRYDILVSGIDSQCRWLAEHYPKTEIPTYAVSGADHEGWYVKSMGVDVGRYAESVMRSYGHPWHDLGYMQADVLLVNANSGKSTVARIMHPGGGSAYAISYRPQKILESMEGGEKPGFLALGHYHKLDAGLIRNVFYCQTGCGQDQTPFMAQKSLEAHVGGALIEIEQDPETGALIEYTPRLRRYFNRKYYFDKGLGNDRWSGSGPIRQVPRRAAQP